MEFIILGWNIIFKKRVPISNNISMDGIGVRRFCRLWGLEISHLQMCGNEVLFHLWKFSVVLCLGIALIILVQ